jgi:hypothetical protein
MGKEQDNKNRSGKVKGGFEESNSTGSRKVGGYEEQNGRDSDDTSKVQHYETPIGHEEALSKARSMSDYDCSPPKNGDHASNDGYSESMRAMKKQPMEVGKKASDYRIVSEAKPAKKAKSQG